MIKVACVPDIQPGKAKCIHLSDFGIAIFNADGTFYAIEDRCAKDGCSLSEGMLTGTMVQCPNDGAKFYLPTGECIDPLTLRWVTCFRVWIEGDDIKIELKEDKKPAPIYPFRIEAHSRAFRGANHALPNTNLN